MFNAKLTINDPFPNNVIKMNYNKKKKVFQIQT